MIGVRVRRDVEHLVREHAGEGRRGDVAHGVRARADGGDAGLREHALHVDRLLDLEVVDLDVLPRGHVRDAAPPALGHLGERVELIGA